MNRRSITLTLLTGLALAACVERAPADLSPSADDMPASADPAQEEPPAAGPPDAPPPGDATRQVTLRTDKEVYRAGESIVVTIDNNSTAPVQFVEVCALHLCQQSGEDWICEEKECDGPATVLDSGDQLGILMEAMPLFPAGQSAEPGWRYKLDYRIVSEDPYYFAHSNPFAVAGQGPDCGQARQVALNHAQSTDYWNQIDVNRARITWLDEDQTCLVDFAWQGTAEILPGLWAEGYSVVVGAKLGRVREAYAYER